MLIPPIRPEEFYLGWLGRIRLFNHFPNNAYADEALRHHFVADWRLGRRPSLLYVLARISGKTFREFVSGHTLLPLAEAFESRFRFEGEDVERVDATWRNHPNAMRKCWSWFCPECMQEDLDTIGMSYWRRRHQLIGVNWCPTHGTKLRYFRTRRNADLPVEPYILWAQHKNSIGTVRDTGSLDAVSETIRNYVGIVNRLLDERMYLGLQALIDELKTMLAQCQMETGIPDPDVFNGTFFAGVSGAWLESFVGVDEKPVKWDLETLLAGHRTYHHIPRSLVLLSGAYRDEEDAFEILRRIHVEALTKRFFEVPKDKDFVREGGSHKRLARGLNMSRRHVSDALNHIGLVNISGLTELTLQALADFYSGAGLADILVRPGIQVCEVERVLRETGGRLEKCIQPMLAATELA